MDACGGESKTRLMISNDGGWDIYESMGSDFLLVKAKAFFKHGNITITEVLDDHLTKNFGIEFS